MTKQNKTIRDETRRDETFVLRMREIYSNTFPFKLTRRRHSWVSQSLNSYIVVHSADTAKQQLDTAQQPLSLKPTHPLHCPP
jgi:hypothetical protein